MPPRPSSVRISYWPPITLPMASVCPEPSASVWSLAAALPSADPEPSRAMVGAVVGSTPLPSGGEPQVGQRGDALGCQRWPCGQERVSDMDGHLGEAA